jgi:hypothetical protein
MNYAVIGTFSMDRAKVDAQRVGLASYVIPKVKDLPGFLHGSWSYDPTESRSYSYIVWKTEADAKAMIEILKADTSRSAEAGVQLQSITVVQVWGEAQGA